MSLFNITAEIGKITFSQCAEQCKSECIMNLQRTALNNGLWLVFVSMFLLTLYYFLSKNEDAIRKVSLITKQPDTKHIENTLSWLLFFGIACLIAYIAYFLISLRFMNPLG